MGIRKLFLALFLSCLTFPANAGGGFGTTFGAGTTDRIATGYTTTLATTITVSMWVYQHAGGGGGGGTAIDKDSASSFYVRPQNASFQFKYPFSTTPGVWSFASGGLTLNTLHHIGITYDATSTSNAPIIYVDGVAQSLTVTVPPVGTANPATTTLSIGNNPAGTRNFDGVLSEIAYWNVILTPNEITALSHHAPTLKIRPASLKFYFPLYANGTAINEADWGPSHTQISSTTGTKGQFNAPINPYPLMGDLGQ